MDAQQIIRLIQETNTWELFLVGIAVGISGLVFSIIKLMKRNKEKQRSE
jgi:hypothetical protein